MRLKVISNSVWGYGEFQMDQVCVKAKAHNSKIIIGDLNSFLHFSTGFLLAFMLASAGVGLAQLDSASILGTITDATGAVIPSATVTISNEGTSAVTRVTTNGSGGFAAPALPIGLYTVTTEVSGFQTNRQLHIRLQTGQRVNLNISLAPGSQSQSVTVSGGTPLVDTASSTLGAVIPTAEINELPLSGRSLQNVLEVAPGFKTLGTFSVNGAVQSGFSSGIHFLLDGSDASQIDSDFVGAAYNSGQRITRASLDDIQEMQVLTGNFSAEYGQSNGAIINIITKSGTNNFHGSLFEYNQNAVFYAKPYLFNPGLNPAPTTGFNQFGGGLGGPILPDKLFFHVNYEGIRQTTGTPIIEYVPTPLLTAALPAALQPFAAQLPAPNGPILPGEPRLALFTNNGATSELTENTNSIKVDYQLTPKDRLTGRWNRNGSNTINPYGAGLGQTQTIPGLLQTGQAEYSKVFSPKFFNEASVNVNRMRYTILSSNVDAVRAEPIILSGAGLGQIGPRIFDLPVGNTSFSYLNTLTWIKGRNQIKMGVQIIRNDQNKGVNPQDIVVFLTLDQMIANHPDHIQTLGYPVTGIRLTYSNAFIQNDVQLNQHLSLNVGMRYIHDSVPTEAHNRMSNYNPAAGTLDPPGTQVMTQPWLDFDPRFGFAYSPFESGHTAIRGAFGIFHSDFNVAYVQNLVANAFSQNVLQFGSQDSNLVGIPFPVNGSQSPLPVSLLSVPKTGWSDAYTEQWNLNVQQQIGKTMSVQVGYIGNSTLHQAPGIDINRIIPARNGLPAVRPNSKYASIVQYTPVEGGSFYNAMQFTFKRQFSNSLSFDVNYTFSHALDEGGQALDDQIQDDHNLPGEYGNSNADIRHYLEFDYIYRLPGIPKVPAILGNGWQINGITGIRSGLPYSVYSGVDTYGTGEGVWRADRVSGLSLQPANTNIPNGPQINRAAFAIPQIGTWGNSQRNLLHGPGAVNFDMSVFRNFKIKERGTLNFRAEAFNIFNHPNFANPSNNVSIPGLFGVTQALSAPMRTMQVAVRYDF